MSGERSAATEAARVLRGEACLGCRFYASRFKHDYSTEHFCSRSRASPKRIIVADGWCGRWKSVVWGTVRSR